jgi:large subunit ribosomal protein L31
MQGPFWFGSEVPVFTRAIMWVSVRTIPCLLLLAVLSNTSRLVRIRGRPASTLFRTMKDKIHPKYYTDAQVTCACGNTFVTGSTQKVLKVEVCSNCHPFFTGERRIMDTAGQVERFKRRYKLEG